MNRLRWLSLLIVAATIAGTARAAPEARSVTGFGLDDGAVRLRADRSGRSFDACPSVPSGKNQPATGRAVRGPGRFRALL
jgi:hypothetical protein